MKRRQTYRPLPTGTSRGLFLAWLTAASIAVAGTFWVALALVVRNG